MRSNAKRVRITRITILSLFFNLFVGVILGTSDSAPKKQYLSQDYIDSSIQRAFYILNEAASVAGIGFRQQEAITAAKKISAQLKQLGKGDPNEKYILWKTGELDAQLYLEERDLVYQKMQKGQIKVNELIARFNAELGKTRPDFATLKRIHVQMGQIDIDKSNEIASSYNQRYKAISREVVYNIEKTLMSGDYKKAREELGYCLRNRAYLTISNSRYKQLEKQLDNLTKAQEEMPQINDELKSAKELIAKRKLGEARDLISSIEYRLERIKSVLTQGELNNVKRSISDVSRRFSSAEDSLVNVNISLLQSKGVKAADEFLRNVLQPYGVSREKIAYVNKAILSISSPDDTLMKSEINDVVTDEKDTDDHGFTSIYSSVIQKAQNRMDSLMAAEQQQMELEEQKRAEEENAANVASATIPATTKTVSYAYSANTGVAMPNTQTATNFSADKPTTTANANVNQQSQDYHELASQMAIRLYTLIEQNRTSEASELFKVQNDFLKYYLPTEGYEVLKSSITSTPFTNEPVNTITYIEETSTQSSTSNSSDNSKQDVNKEKAQQMVISIYDMLEKNDINGAYNKFNDNRKPLQKYLDKDVFQMLETTITQAYTFNSP